ncbi:hypothetical protein TM7_0354 [candidate division TM7 genomosp. GTL1]|nr:hypothetical protein TM7_0354 [candidate division TM7 genomosp. GTL1]
MQCATDLVKLRDSIISRVIYLRQIVSSITTPLGPEDRRALAYVTIELDNLIVVGLRQYTKSSLLRSRTADGMRITAAVQPASTEEAAALIFRSINPAGYQKSRSPIRIREKDEIAVRDPKLVEKVLVDYSASNLPKFVIALSLNAEVFKEAKICRHYFAHRARNTYEAVQALAANLGIVGVNMPEHLILRGRPGTGVRILDGWLADIENFFDLAA